MIKMEFQIKKKYVKDKSAYPTPIIVSQRLIPPVSYNQIGYNMIANVNNSTQCGVCPHS
jgi:hypothetical protein